ncbi:MAG: class I SAM-dependent methyltransferase [Burkholderiales bacterium]
MRLLPQSELVQTSRVDHADWNYRPVLAYVMRRRFALILSLLPRRAVHRMLEIGFGSGILMPELARRCRELYGIDVHSEVAEVQARLKRFGVPATLSRQDAANTNFPDAFFDAIVSVSALEFVEDIDDAAREFARLLAPDGKLVAVMPAKSALLDFALRAATGENAQRDYGDRRERVLPALLKYFRVLRVKRFVPIYTAYEFEAVRS